MTMTEDALERGVFAQAIRPPTVPDGMCRIRAAVMASHKPDELRCRRQHPRQGRDRRRLRPRASACPASSARHWRSASRRRRTEPRIYDEDSDELASVA